jgi:hypothetical protein
MLPRATSRLGLSAVAALAICACGSGTAKPTPVTLSVSTGHGLSYAVQAVQTGTQQCVTATYKMSVAKRTPVVQGSHLCGAPAGPGHPILVQAHGSSESIVADVSATGCGAVHGGSTHASLHLLVSRCSASASGRDLFRATILPGGRRLVLVGVPGAPVINFPRHVCRRGVCVTPLA